MRQVCILFLFIGCFQFSYAATYYVSSSGNDGGDGSQGNPWRTLKHAASRVAANQGHIIKISGGTFVENGPIDIPVGVSIDGSGIDVTIIKSSSSFYYNPGSPGFGGDKYLINFKSNGQVNGNQSIKNLTVDGDGKKLHGAIFVQNRNNFLAENIKIIYTNFSGMWLLGSNNSAIKNLKLLDCAWGSTGWCSGALQIANSVNVDVSNFDISEQRGYGIKNLGHTNNTPVSNVKIHDGRVSVNPHGAWNDGKAPNITIEFWGSSFPGTEIYNCYIDNTLSLVNATDYGPGVRTTPIKIYNNTFDINGPRAGGYGYSIELSINDAEVYGNFFNGGSAAMVNWHIKQCMGWNIHHNTFYNISRMINSQNKGVSGGGLKDIILANNSVEMNGGVTAFLEINGSVAENVKIQNNLFISSSTSPKLVSAVAGGSVRNSTISNNFYSGLTNVSIAGATISNNFTGDPQITKTGNRPNPFWLPTNGSPLIDKGVNLGYAFQGAAPEIGAYEYGSNTVPPVNKLPGVNLTAPANNTNFLTGTSITITANASDTDGLVSKVEFFNGATKLGEDLTSPYSFVWNNAAAGNYTISAKATDNQAGVTTSTPINISITAANPLPTIAITAPTNNAVVPAGSSITITANAADANGTVSKVEFFNGTVKLGEDLVGPYSFAWNNIPNGTHAITAKATDNQGGVTTSTVVNLTVSNGNNPPIVTLTSPAASATFSAGSSVTIAANASDANGAVTKVEFFQGSTKLGEDLTSPYNFNWISVPEGTYSLSARATDNLGATTISNSINIIVSSSTNSPSIVITSPLDNSTFSSGTSILITADAATITGSIIKVEFFNGNTKLGEDLTSPYSFTWNSVPTGNYTLAAKVTDNQGSTEVDEIQILVGNNPSADAGEDKTVVLPASSIEILGTGTSGDGSTLTYSWSQVSGPNIASISNTNSDLVILANLIQGSYVIELSVTDSHGFISKDLVMINVGYSEEAADNIPRYFSPNDDGIKDVWEWPNLELFANSTLLVFNRSGQKIYEAVSYKNTWDGSVDGQPLQNGDYYYVIRLSEGDNIKGAVQIIR